MIYIKLFNTEQEKQACTDKYEYLSYTVESDKVNIHEEEPPFFCKLTLEDETIVDIEDTEGNGELISDMIYDYSETTVSVEIGELCTSIGGYAFGYLPLLTSVIIGNCVTSIGEYAFDSCESLSNITIPNSVTSIGMCAFWNCAKLTSITIPNSVTNIGDGAFHNCRNLTSVTSLATTAPTITEYTFSGVKSNGKLYVPQNSSGYDVWMGTGNYYLGSYGWTQETIS